MAVKKDQVIIRKNYTGMAQVDSDAFKLKVAAYKKPVFVGGNDTIQADVEHCHFYHTYDSDGRPMQECNAVGGHKHEVKVEYNDKNEIIRMECMPSLNHTHELIYLKSDKVQLRTRSEEFARIMAGIKPHAE